MTILAPVIAPAPEPVFPEDVLRNASQWLRELTTTWSEEVPIQLHSSDLDEGGGPKYHPSFKNYIERDCRKPGCFNLQCSHGQDRPDPRKRTHKALGKLRRWAPREFDALWMIVARNMSVREVARALTERSLRLGKPERYSEQDVLVLVVSGIHKIESWW